MQEIVEIGPLNSGKGAMLMDARFRNGLREPRAQ
jgi:hypothetical protein